MKKFCCMAAVLVLSLALSACGDNNETAALQARIEQLEQANEELSERLSAVEAAFAEAQTVPGAGSAAEAAGEASAERTEAPAPSESEPEDMQLIGQAAAAVKAYMNTQAARNCGIEKASVEKGMTLSGTLFGDSGDQKANVLMICLETDRDLYGYLAGMVMIDLDTGAVFHEGNVNLNVIDPNDGYDGFMGYVFWAFGEVAAGNGRFVFNNEDKVETLTSQQVEQINAYLS